MDISENGTDIHISFTNGEGEKVTEFNPSIEELLLETQVSGKIQGFEQVEIGLYTEPAIPLCYFGTYVAVRIPIEKFILTSEWVKIGMKSPGKKSPFAHMTHWLEGNTEDNVYLNLDMFYQYWLDKFEDTESIELKMMLSGINGSDTEVLMREKPVLTFTKDVTDQPSRKSDDDNEIIQASFEEILEYMFVGKSVVKLTDTPGMLIYYRLKVPDTILKFSSFESDDLYTMEILTKDQFKELYESGDFNVIDKAGFMSIDRLPSHLKWKEG